MEQALREAEKAFARGEIPVGALVVAPSGQILSRAGNEMEERGDATAHAEILALRQAASISGKQRLSGCILVATLEPCLMCAGALSHSRIAGLVYGAADARAGAITSCADYGDLPGASAKIWHMGGILAERCAAPLRIFFNLRRLSCRVER